MKGFIFRVLAPHLEEAVLHMCARMTYHSCFKIDLARRRLHDPVCLSYHEETTVVLFNMLSLFVPLSHGGVFATCRRGAVSYRNEYHRPYSAVCKLLTCWCEHVWLNDMKKSVLLHIN